MTSLDADRPGERADSTASADRPKAVLFCPACDHKSRVGGDWVESDDTDAGTRTLRCPECSQRVTDRPLPGDARLSPDSTASLLAGGVQTAGDFWAGLVRVWLGLGSRRGRTARTPGSRRQ